MPSTHDFGKEGEDIAVQYLRNKGYAILLRNYRCGKNEVDIIAKIGNTLAFVEVKYRKRLTYGHPLQAITAAKQQEIAKAATCFIQKNPSHDTLYRFDVVAILERTEGREITHLEDAFRMM